MRVLDFTHGITVSRDRLEWIASKSLINCHTMGVDSVMFDDTPGARVRAFIAQPNHDLWKNAGIRHKLSVAIHSHHCDVELRPVFGEIWNMVPAGDRYGKVYEAYRYDSPISTGHGSFVREGKLDYKVCLHSLELLRPLPMKARDEHTIWVGHGSRAGWFVYEGAEDPNYNAICWSDDDLTRFDFSPLYKPMSVEYLTGLLSMLQVRITP